MKTMLCVMAILCLTKCVQVTVLPADPPPKIVVPCGLKKMGCV